MPTVIHNTPIGLVPKELFNEEKIQEYWNILYPNPQQENIGADEMEEFYLLYPKSKDTETVHYINLMYKSMKDNFPTQTDAICFDLSADIINLLVLKDKNIVYIGRFFFSVNEDIVYHLAHVAQHFFEDISRVKFFYPQLPSKILRFLEKYFEMKKM